MNLKYTCSHISCKNHIWNVQCHVFKSEMHLGVKSVERFWVFASGTERAGVGLERKVRRQTGFSGGVEMKPKETFCGG